MPNREPNPDLFRRWLLIVYLPLAVFVILLALVIGRILTGASVWFVTLLGLYCVIPVRLILETQRKGLELPKPPSSTRPAASQRRNRPRPRPSPEGQPSLRGDEDFDDEFATRRRGPSPRAREDLDEEFATGPSGVTPRGDQDLDDEFATRRRRPAAPAPEDFDDEFATRRPELAPRGAEDLVGELRDGRTPDATVRRRRAVPAGRGRPREMRAPVERPQRPTPRKSPQIVRRRAMASLIGIGVLLLVGGILVVVGIGRVTSSFGLIMVGVGGFLMILSVTLPTFRLVDAILRAVGRLLSRRPARPSRARPPTRRRSA